MSEHGRAKRILLMVSDAVLFYAALIVALAVRDHASVYTEFTGRHLVPFSIVFGLWLIVFYISGLYDLRRLRNSLDFMKTLITAIIVNAILAVAFFYLVPYFGIAPKTNLFMVLALSALLGIWWRRFFNRRLAMENYLEALALVGNHRPLDVLATTLEENPQFGFRVLARNYEHNAADVRDMSIDTIVIPRSKIRQEPFASLVNELILKGKDVYDSTSFFELIIRYIPLEDVEHEWFVTYAVGRNRFYDKMTRAVEFSLALIMFMILFPLGLLLALLVRLTSKGSAMYSQKRVGLYGKEFILYKFRTMRRDAETNGAQWSKPGDNRVTKLGKLLRHTHIDELPQLINVIRGDLSFVGPRPERPEFVALLETQLPFYNMRHLVRPGVTGWAQINYRYGSTVEDARRKLEYDLYYIKNRSVILDLTIILKTLRLFFVAQK